MTFESLKGKINVLEIVRQRVPGCRTGVGKRLSPVRGQIDTGEVQVLGRLSLYPPLPATTLDAHHYWQQCSQTAAYLSVVVVAVVVIALTEVAAVSELRLFLTDGVTDATATLAPTVVTADRTRVVPEHTTHTLLISQEKSIIGLQDLFTLDKNNKGTIGQTLKLIKMRCTRDCWKYFFHQSGQ